VLLGAGLSTVVEVGLVPEDPDEVGVPDDTLLSLRQVRRGLEGEQNKDDICRILLPYPHLPSGSKDFYLSS